MQPFLFITSLAILATSTVAALSNNITTKYCIPHSVTPAEQSKIFSDYVQTFYVLRDVPASFQDYIVSDYIQHNPYELGNGAAISEKVLTTMMANTSIQVEILHQGFTSGLGWVHSRWDGMNARPTAIMDVFGFADSCIKEHWDVTQEVPEDATNALALF